MNSSHKYYYFLYLSLFLKESRNKMNAFIMALNPEEIKHQKIKSLKDKNKSGRSFTKGYRRSPTQNPQH
jgi:hypothetical protein